MPAITRARLQHALTANRRGDVLKGCLIALAIFLVIAIIIIVIVAMNWRGWVGGGMDAAMTQLIQSSELSSEEKDGLNAEVDDLVQRFKDKDVSFAQLGQVVNELAESPVLYAGAAYAFDKNYVAASSLTDEEKAAGTLTLQRVARGVHEGTLDKQIFNTITASISTGEGENKKLKQPADVTPEELRTLIADAKAKADEAGVPDEPFDFDVVQEVSDAIDRATGTPGA